VCFGQIGPITSCGLLVACNGRERGGAGRDGWQRSFLAKPKAAATVQEMVNSCTAAPRELLKTLKK
jgi:hypothetical protein